MTFRGGEWSFKKSGSRKILAEFQGSRHKSTTLLVGLPVSFFIMAVGFNERKHGVFLGDSIGFLFSLKFVLLVQNKVQYFYILIVGLIFLYEQFLVIF